VSRFAFSYRFQRSPQFDGRRRKARGADSTSAAPNGAFRSLKTHPATMNPADGIVTIHIGNAVRVACAIEVALTVIAWLAREARP